MREKHNLSTNVTGGDTATPMKVDSVVRIGKKKHENVFKIRYAFLLSLANSFCYRDDSRYPPTALEEQKYLRKQKLDQIYSRAIQSLVKQAYEKKSVGSIPRGKS
jgi:hypothetical protein